MREGPGDGVSGSFFIVDVSASMLGRVDETAVFTCAGGSAECREWMGEEPSNRRWRPGNGG